MRFARKEFQGFWNYAERPYNEVPTAKSVEKEERGFFDHLSENYVSIVQ